MSAGGSVWIFGISCDFWLVPARLTGTTGSDGIVALLADWETSGVQAEDLVESLGVRGTDHAHLTLERAPVPVANRVGDEGRGLEVALGGGFPVGSRSR